MGIWQRLGRRFTKRAASDKSFGASYASAGRPSAEEKSAPTPSLIPRTKKHPQWRDWSTQHAWREGYRASTWVYNAIEIRRRAVASVPWHVEVRRGEEWERAPDHPLQLLLDEPNPDFTQRQMISRLVQWLDLGGNVYWTKVRAGRPKVPVEVWPLMPDAMRAIPGGKDGRMIGGYRYEWENVKTTFPAEDIVHWTYPNPGDFYYGMSPLRAAGMATDIDTEAQRFQKVSLQNRGIPDGVFTLQGDTITREQWEQAREQVREQYQNKDAYRSPWVVGHAKWEQMSLSPADLDYVESRKFTREEILSAFNTPPPLVGIYDNATLSNIETARKIFWLDGICPLLEELRDQLQAALVPEFGRPSELRIVYDLTNVDALREKFQDKVTAAESLWRMGVPFNQISQRLEMNIEDIPGGDVGFVSASLIPTDMATATGEGLEGEPGEEMEPAAVAEDADRDGELSGGLNGAQVQAVLSIIEQVARGDLPRASAVAIIAGSFPISEDGAEAMIGSVGTSFFLEDDPEAEERARLPEEVKRRVDSFRAPTVGEMVKLAYGDEEA